MPAANATQKKTAIRAGADARMASLADDNDCEREGHLRRHRPLPEIQRVCARRSEQQEAQDEPEVRRTEDAGRGRRSGTSRAARRQPFPQKIHHPAGSTSLRVLVPGTPRRTNATPFPVRSALAGHISTRCRRKAIATSSTPHVRSAATRICAIESWNPNAVCPSTWSETITPLQARVLRRRQEHRVLRTAEVDGRPAGHDGGRAHGALCVTPIGLELAARGRSRRLLEPRRQLRQPTGPSRGSSVTDAPRSRARSVARRRRPPRRREARAPARCRTRPPLLRSLREVEREVLAGAEMNGFRPPAEELRVEGAGTGQVPGPKLQVHDRVRRRRPHAFL